MSMTSIPDRARYIEMIERYSLIGANLERADLRGKYLRNANFTNANLRGADLTKADLRGAVFARADLSRACLYGADCEGADFSAADMSMSYLRAVNFSKAVLWNTTLRRCYAKNAIFFDADLRSANVAFTDFLGSRFNGAKLDGIRNAETATFYWYWPPGGGPIEYKWRPGLVRLDGSITGGISLQENAARGAL